MFAEKKSISRVLVIAMALLMVMLQFNIAASANSTYSGYSVKHIRNIPNKPYYYWQPGDITFDNSGNMYVLDTDNDSIVKVSPEGKIIASWGDGLEGSGFLQDVSSMVLGKDGNLYVMDTFARKIKIVSPQGDYLDDWDFSQGENRLNYPYDMEMDSQGNVYVADTENNRILKINPNGEVILKFGTTGSGQGQFKYPFGVAVDNEGSIYVADRDNRRIQKFTGQGTFIAEWPSNFEGSPWDIEVSQDGKIYALYRYSNVRNNRIYEYSKDGVILNSWEYPLCEMTKLYVHANGNIYSAASGTVFQINSQGNIVNKLGSFGYTGSDLNFPESIAVDNQGNVFVVDTQNELIKKYKSNGEFIFSFGKDDVPDHSLSSPMGITLDSRGNIYVSDNSRQVIFKFNSSGQYVKSIGTGNYELPEPYGLAIDKNDNIYVAENYLWQVFVYSPEGEKLRAIGTPDNGYGADRDGELLQPSDVAVDAAGNVYVTEQGFNRVSKFDAQGKFVTRWGKNGGDGTKGSGEGEFNEPMGIGLDKNGNVYVADTENNRIQVFDSNGNFLYKWGTEGNNNGELLGPYDVEVSDIGEIYVSDRENHRIQVFKLAAQELKITGTSIANNSRNIQPNPEITITFNELIKEGALTLSQVVLKQGSLEIASEKRIEGSNLILKPKGLLDYGKAYILSVPAGSVTGVSGADLPDNFSLSFETVPILAKPVLTSSNTEPTNEDVIITAVFDERCVEKVYSVDDGITWVNYGNPGIKVSENRTILAKGKDSYGTWTEVAEIRITNIDKLPPEKPEVNTTLSDDRKSVTARIENREEGIKAFYSIDGGRIWKDFIGPVTLNDNCTLMVKLVDPAGNESEAASVEIKGIESSNGTGDNVNNLPRTGKDIDSTILIVTGLMTLIAGAFLTGIRKARKE